MSTWKRSAGSTDSLSHAMFWLRSDFICDWYTEGIFRGMCTAPLEIPISFDWWAGLFNWTVGVTVSVCLSRPHCTYFHSINHGFGEVFCVCRGSLLFTHNWWIRIWPVRGRPSVPFSPKSFAENPQKASNPAEFVAETVNRFFFFFFRCFRTVLSNIWKSARLQSSRNMILHLHHCASW